MNVLQNRYPRFVKNRILKKEMLEALRDYSFAYAQLKYQNYGQGILCGCDVSVEEKQLVVGKGMIKCGSWIGLLTEELAVPYGPAAQMQYLKLLVSEREDSLDEIVYRIALVLDTKEVSKGKEERNLGQKEENAEKKEGDAGQEGENTGINVGNEIEICRFYLRDGARLRGEYKDFADRMTEYDTINRIYADWGALRGQSLDPSITGKFAEILIKSRESQAEDFSFACLCLNQNGAVPREIIRGYLAGKLGRQVAEDAGNQELFQMMCQVVSGLDCGMEREVLRREKRRIWVE